MSSEPVNTRFKKLENSFDKLDESKYTDFLQECKSTEKQVRDILKSDTFKGTKKLKLELVLNHVLSLKARVKKLIKKSEKYVSVKDGPSAFNQRISSKIFINHRFKNVKEFLFAIKSKIVRILRQKLTDYTNVKVYFVFVGKFEAREIIQIKHIYTSTEMITATTNVRRWYKKKMIPSILSRIDEFEMNGSGFSLKEIVHLTLNINKCNIISGGTYIELPAVFKSKHSVINPKNNDNYCFLWSLCIALYPDDKFFDLLNVNGVSSKKEKMSYQKFNAYFKNLKNYDFPMSLSNVEKFALENDISINVYVISKHNKILPIVITPLEKDRHVDLLLLTEVDEKNGVEKMHYCYIKNLCSFTSSQISKHKAPYEICRVCMCYFTSKEKLIKHKEHCSKINKGALTMPDDENKFIKFKNYQYQLKKSHVIYSDVETILKKDISDDDGVLQKHEVYSIGIFLQNGLDNERSFYTYGYGDDVLEWFTTELVRIADIIQKVSLLKIKKVFVYILLFYRILK